MSVKYSQSNYYQVHWIRTDLYISFGAENKAHLLLCIYQHFISDFNLTVKKLISKCGNSFLVSCSSPSSLVKALPWTQPPTVWKLVLQVFAFNGANQEQLTRLTHASLETQRWWLRRAWQGWTHSRGEIRFWALKMGNRSLQRFNFGIIMTTIWSSSSWEWVWEMHISKPQTSTMWPWMIFPGDSPKKSKKERNFMG